MERAAGMNAARGRHQAAGGLPVRPAAGAALARTQLEYRGAHRAPTEHRPDWAVDPAVLRRVRDALVRGGGR